MKKNILYTTVFCVLFALVCVASWLKPESEFSLSERRYLTKAPDPSYETILSGEFMSEFENYTVDQFPMRDSFRKLKALFSKYLLQRTENHGVFTADGHISKIEYPLNSHMIDFAAEKFDYLYETYMKDADNKIYLSIVPDKNYFLKENNFIPTIDYDAMVDEFKNRLDYMEYIDIFDHLSLDDYYTTDSHWKQENITDVAEHLASSMGVDIKNIDYTQKTLERDFNGVFKGQSAYISKPDTIKYLENNELSKAVAYYYDTGVAKQGDIYDIEKAYGKDPYEIFLSGSAPYVKIENPNAKTDKELILFRDSFASSLAPLLVPGYKTIHIFDIRYMQSSFIGEFLEFNDQDVLFIYSTTILNNSTSLR